MTYIIATLSTMALVIAYIVIRLWWALRHEWTDFDQPTKSEFMGRE